LTGKGTILGTVPYMAPEQLEGKPADARTDLWALGAIVYEMVAGRRAFEGSSQVSLIAAIVEREPASLSTLQPVTPPSLERLVKRCLAKSPDDRWDSAHDVADELRWIAQTGLTPSPGPVTGHAPWWRWSLSAIGLLAAGAALGALVQRNRPAPITSPAVVRSLLDVHPAEDVDAGASASSATPGGSRTSFAWTPDGRALVVIGRRAGTRQLYVRKLDQHEATPLSGTEGARVLAVSPDGQWVAFWANGRIRKISLAGGPASTLVERVAEPPSGMSWGPSGRLLYDSGPRPPAAAGESGAIWSVEPEHPPAAATRRLDDEASHGLPHCLPGGRVLLYTARHGMYAWGDEEVVAQDLVTGARKVLLREAADARYAVPGHLVFLRRGTLFAVAFDLPRLETRGTPVPILDSVAQALAANFAGDVTGAGQSCPSGRHA